MAVWAYIGAGNNNSLTVYKPDKLSTALSALSAAKQIFYYPPSRWDFNHIISSLWQIEVTNIQPPSLISSIHISYCKSRDYEQWGILALVNIKPHKHTSLIGTACSYHLWHFTSKHAPPITHTVIPATYVQRWTCAFMCVALSHTTVGLSESQILIDPRA